MLVCWLGLICCAQEVETLCVHDVKGSETDFTGEALLMFARETGFFYTGKSKKSPDLW